MQLAIISDTHLTGRRAAIPESFRDRVAAADHVVHAGDVETPDVLDDVRSLAPTLTAVHGNADPADIGLPAVDAVTLDGVTFVVTHGTLNLAEAAVYSTDGLVTSDADWLDAVADTARVRTRAWTGDDAVVGIGGHSHEVVDEVHEGIRVLNPGTATGTGEGRNPTMMTVGVEDGALEVAVHEP